MKEAITKPSPTSLTNLTNKNMEESKKDPNNCPFCEAEIKGHSSGWGFSPEGWQTQREIHDKNHKN